ncbi:hypothetical protein OPV22_003321 [Ensete ventricosum]|uniref:Uncharacterized protein n=1 Tax=Ensete ventricosum TaxID=4639 RepID=A0AAV8S0J3_ENSVE|nr:hypothetical protein OPV22_003321 [Ensete ventricosum]
MLWSRSRLRARGAVALARLLRLPLLVVVVRPLGLIIDDSEKLAFFLFSAGEVSKVARILGGTKTEVAVVGAQWRDGMGQKVMHGLNGPRSFRFEPGLGMAFKLYSLFFGSFIKLQSSHRWLWPPKSPPLSLSHIPLPLCVISSPLEKTQEVKDYLQHTNNG